LPCWIYVLPDDYLYVLVSIQFYERILKLALRDGALLSAWRKEMNSKEKPSPRTKAE
jgi:hypothetical protein